MAMPQGDLALGPQINLFFLHPTLTFGKNGNAVYEKRRGGHQQVGWEVERIFIIQPNLFVHRFYLSDICHLLKLLLLKLFSYSLNRVDILEREKLMSIEKHLTRCIGAG